MFFAIFTLVLAKDAEALQVIGGNVTVVEGSTAILPCYLKDATEKLSVISWQKMTKKNPNNVNFFSILSERSQYFNGRDLRFTFAGNFTEKNGTLRLFNVSHVDQGIYTCIFTLFPSENHQTEIPLNVLVPPSISVTGDIPTLGDKEVLLSTCTASSHTPAQVTWDVGNLTLRITSNSSVNADGTTTTVSTLWGVPTIELNGCSVQCVVTSEALSTAKIQLFTIQIHFPPTDVNVQEKSSGLFECVSNGNPEVQYTWSSGFLYQGEPGNTETLSPVWNVLISGVSFVLHLDTKYFLCPNALITRGCFFRSDHPWPHSSVKVDGSQLHILSMTSDINGVFTCKASNLYGEKNVHLNMNVISGSCHPCWILCTLLVIVFVLLLVGAAFWCYKCISFPRYRDLKHSILQLRVTLGHVLRTREG